MQMTIRNLGSLALVALVAGCASSSLEVGFEASAAQRAGNHAKAAELYSKAAEIARNDKNADVEAMHLLDAAESRALVKSPGSREEAIRQITRARELFRNPGASSFSKQERTAWMARTWAAQAGIVADSDPTQARQYLDTAMSICRGAIAANIQCTFTASQASKVAEQRNVSMTLRHLGTLI